MECLENVPNWFMDVPYDLTTRRDSPVPFRPRRVQTSCPYRWCKTLTKSSYTLCDTSSSRMSSWKFLSPTTIVHQMTSFWNWVLKPIFLASTTTILYSSLFSWKSSTGEVVLFLRPNPLNSLQSSSSSFFYVRPFIECVVVVSVFWVTLHNCRGDTIKFRRLFVFGSNLKYTSSKYLLCEHFLFPFPWSTPSPKFTRPLPIHVVGKSDTTPRFGTLPLPLPFFLPFFPRV